MSDLENDFETTVSHLTELMQKSPTLRARFFAHAFWGQLLPLPKDMFEGRLRWRDRYVLLDQIGKRRISSVDFIRVVYDDLLSRTDLAIPLGEDEIAAYDPELIARYRTYVCKRPHARIPELSVRRIPSWQRRLLEIGTHTDRQEISALSFALRRAYKSMPT